MTLDDFHFASILVSTVRNAPVLIFAAMAGLFAERSGVIDIGLEGKILASAFVSAAVAFLTQNPWYGIAAGTLLGAQVAGRVLGKADRDLAYPVTPLTPVRVRPFTRALVGSLMNAYRIVDAIELRGSYLSAGR